MCVGVSSSCIALLSCSTCSVLQSVAVCCSVLQGDASLSCSACTRACQFIRMMLDHTCSKRGVWCVAVCCILLQYVAHACQFIRLSLENTCSKQGLRCAAVCHGVLQCFAVCCSVLQCVAVCCSVLQFIAVCRTYLPMYTYDFRNIVQQARFAVCCSM